MHIPPDGDASPSHTPNPPIVVCYYHTMSMVDHRLKFYLAIRYIEMVKMEVKGSAGVYQHNKMQNLVAFHQMGGSLILNIIVQNQRVILNLLPRKRMGFLVDLFRWG